MTTKLDYFSAIAKKRPWQAMPVTSGLLVDGAEETIFRALAIRHLELPVKDMLLEGLKRDLPNTPGLIASIESNINCKRYRHEEETFLGSIAFCLLLHTTGTRWEGRIPLEKNSNQ